MLELARLAVDVDGRGRGIAGGLHVAIAVRGDDEDLAGGACECRRRGDGPAVDLEQGQEEPGEAGDAELGQPLAVLGGMQEAELLVRGRCVQRNPSVGVLNANAALAAPNAWLERCPYCRTAAMGRSAHLTRHAA